MRSIFHPYKQFSASVPVSECVGKNVWKAKWMAIETTSVFVVWKAQIMKK